MVHSQKTTTLADVSANRAMLIRVGENANQNRLLQARNNKRVS